MCSVQVRMGTGTCDTRLHALRPGKINHSQTPAGERKPDVFVFLGLTGASTGASTGGYPHPFLQVFILRDFKSNEFATADCKGFTGAFWVSVDCKGVADLDERQGITLQSGCKSLCENSSFCQGTPSGV